MSGLPTRRWTRRKVLIAALASIGILAMVWTVVASLVAPILGPKLRDANAPRTQPSSTAPLIIIAPLDVRPVIEARTIAPQECPAVAPPPAPTEPLQTCDIGKTVVYTLGPPALKLRLTDVRRVKLPTGEFFAVQVSMDPSSSAAFAGYTATHVGQQVAFLQKGVVVSAPAITEPINAASLQLSGDFTARAADDIVGMLRKDT